MKYLKEFERYSKQVHRRPTIKNVHELRKSTRKLRCLWPSERLTKLAKVLGKQRDLDVAIINARHFGLDASHLQELRAKQREKTQAYLSKERISKIIDSLKSEQPFPHGLVKLKKELGVWKKNKIKKSNLHELRIFIKKVRYTFEALGKDVPVLKRLQDSLGEIHDLQVLKEYVGYDSGVQKERKLMEGKAMKLVSKTLSTLKIPISP